MTSHGNCHCRQLTCNFQWKTNMAKRNPTEDDPDWIDENRGIPYESDDEDDIDFDFIDHFKDAEDMADVDPDAATVEYTGSGIPDGFEGKALHEVPKRTPSATLKMHAATPMEERAMLYIGNISKS